MNARGPWLLRMRWLDLLFAHWPVDADELRRRLPAGLELDTFEGQAWLGVVPFTMSDVSARGVPAIPRFSTFPELNVRTYVRHRGRAGVWFLTLEARSRPTVLGGRLVFHLPYRHADMAAARHGDAVEYRSRRRREPSAAFHAEYRPTGLVTVAPTGSFDDWSTRRMRLFSADRRGRIWRTEIAHRAWPLQPAEARIDASGLMAALGLSLPDESPRLAFSRRLDVHGWAPTKDGVTPR